MRSREPVNRAGPDLVPDRSERAAERSVAVGGNRATGRLLGASGSIGTDLLLGGNAAVQRLVQRCGPVPCDCDEEERQEYELHRSADGTTSGPSPGFLDAIDRSGAGQALPEDFRAEAEQKFDANLGHVRVHTDTPAAGAAEAVHAHAFTIDHDVYFGAGQYRPDAKAGRRLLAHELTHVVQGGGPHGSGGWVSQPTDPAELAAEAAADRFMAGDRPAVAQINAGSGMRVHRVPGSYDVAEQKKLIEEGIRDKDDGKIKDVEDGAYTLATDSQAIDMILIILRNKWVGPRDENAIYNIWKSRGKGIVELASKYLFVWNMCLDRDVTMIWSIPDVEAVKTDFKRAVAAKARQCLNANKATVDAELKRYGFDDMNAAPSAEKAKEREDLMSAAVAVKKARDALKKMETMLIGYDYTVAPPTEGVDRCVAKFDPAMPPPLPGHKPIAAEPDAVLPSWAETKKNYDRANGVIDHYTKRYPALVALREDSELDTVAKGAVSTEDAANSVPALQLVRKALDDTKANIDKTYPLVDSPKANFALELQPLHEQIFLSDPTWNEPFREKVARQAVKDHDNNEFWETMGVGAIGAALFVVAEFTSGGLATFFFAAAAAGSITQAAVSWDKYFTLKAASGTNMSKETALISREQVSEQLLTAAIDTVMAFVDAYTAAKGGTKALAKASEKEAQLAGMVGKETAIVAAEEMKSARVPTSAGHEIKVTERGIERCSPEPCPLIGKFWENSLERHPGLKARLEKDAQLARTDPVWAARDAAAAERVLQDVSEQEFTEWAERIPEKALLAEDVKFTDMKRLPQYRADIAPTPVPPERVPIIQKRAAELKAQGVLPEDYVYPPPLIPGQVISRAMAKEAQEVLGTLLSGHPAIKACWEDAAKAALEGKILSKENCAEIYKSAQGRFWNRVANEPAAKDFFTSRGYTVNGKRSAFLDVEGVAKQEVSLGLDHIDPKATDENWRVALDADKLQLIKQADNTKMSHLEKKDPSLAR